MTETPNEKTNYEIFLDFIYDMETADRITFKSKNDIVDWDSSEYDASFILGQILALRKALQEGLVLIQGEAVGSEWEKGCADFTRNACAALKGEA